MTDVRRSERSRKVNKTVYDLARQEIIEKSFHEKQKKGSPRKVEVYGSSQSDEDNAEGISEGVESSEESNDDDDDSSQAVEKKRPNIPSVPKLPTKKQLVGAAYSAKNPQMSSARTDNKKIASQPRKKTSPATMNDAKISSSDDSSSESASGVPKSTTTRKRKINTDNRRVFQAKSGVGGGGAKNTKTAFQSLYDQIIEEDEDASNSLLAALMKAAVPLENNHVMTEYLPYLSEVHTLSWPTTPYTPQLYDISRRMIRLHNDDPNEAHIQLINLLLRSVGGTVNSNITTNVCLDHLDDSKWTKMINKVVREIEHTPIQHVLICADPLGAVHAASTVEENGGDIEEKHSSLAVREFRKIYEEFWYVLGVVALTEGNMSAKNHMIEDDEEEEEEPQYKGNKRKVKGSISKSTVKVSTHRFDADLVGEIMHRLLCFTSHRCLDLRAAATVAVIHLGLAVVDRTVLLVEKLSTATRQYNSAVAGSGSSAGRKTDTLRHVVDSIKRNCKDLEEVLTKNVVDTLILHRYRDTNSFIRMISVEALGRLILQRPDLFLFDRYLKYFGWMLSDKADRVRVAALNGLLGPFTALQNTAVETRIIEIDLRQMENVTSKFINRLADCVVDVNATVQEKAMALLLFLLKKGFLDEVEDDNIWNQINLRAIAPDASPKARMDALYFIMEQLEVFDDGNNDDNASRVRNAKPSRTNDDRTISQRLDAIASWIANALVDGPIPIDKIQVSRVKYVVDSLRTMPEGKVIVTKWPLLLSAMKDDNIALTLQGATAGDRVDSAKQRVLVQMFVYSVLAECKNGSAHHLVSNGTKKKRGSIASGDSSPLEESLSLYLLQSLAGLLEKFKSDTDMLESLVTLPQYLSPNVLTAAQHKVNFLSLLKNLSDIYVQSSDEIVLYKIVLSLSHLGQGLNARAKDTQSVLSKIVKKLYDRIVPFLFTDRSSEYIALEKDSGVTPEKNNLGSRRSPRLSKSDEGEDSTTVISTDSETDIECSLSLNLLRMKVLSYRIDISSYLERDTVQEDGKIENFTNALTDGLTHRLNLRLNRKTDLDWSSLEPSEQKIDGYATVVVDEGLQLLLTILAWNLFAALPKEAVILDHSDDGAILDANGDDSEVESTVDHFTLRLRNRLIALIGMCFDQFISEDDVETVCAHRVDWMNSLQESAGLIACDLRMLFPKEWAHTTSPLLRALSLSEDQHVIYGYVRYLRSKTAAMVGSDQSVESIDETVAFLLESMARSLAVSWKNGNRREAAVALSYFNKAGYETSSLVESLMRHMKQVDPTRLLESQMACLRQNYDDWMENEPGEIEVIEGSLPNDAQMEAFQEEEDRHKNQLESLLDLANKLSSSLVTRKKSETQNLSPAILGFIREGVRYAFSNTDDDGEEIYVAGSRLTFLSLLTKYSPWMKSNKANKKVLENDLEQREKALKAHEEFDQIRSDDFAALKEFREKFGLKAMDLSNDADEVDDDDEEESEQLNERTVNNKAVTPELTSLLKPRSGKSSVGSVGTNSLRSRISSNPSTLSPLYEEDHSMDEDDDDENSFSHNEMKKRVGMTMDDTQTTFDGVASM